MYVTPININSQLKVCGKTHNCSKIPADRRFMSGISTKPQLMILLKNKFPFFIKIHSGMHKETHRVLKECEM